ncbi:MAG: aminopeptidase P family protein [Desulfobulbaceae bacterium]|nr:aminopeptidase P family protein [Desulfobulbaceae bacterium]
MNSGYHALAGVQAILRERQLDALIVSQPENRRYLSGYTAPDHGIQESSGFLLIPQDGEPWLLTDSRFTLQAEAEAIGYHLHVYRRGLLEALEHLLPQLDVQSIGFEADYFLFSTHARLLGLAEKLGFRLEAISNLVEDLRVVKTTDELELIRQSTQLNERVFTHVYSQISLGQTERELARLIENTMLDFGADRPSFDTIAAFGENAAKPHAVPSERRLKAGETVLVDMGLVLNGYCSDMSRTFVLGEPDAIFLERLRLVRAAQQAAISTIRAGVTGAAVDQVARDVLREGGYGEAFGHGLGHGVGLAVHEAPRLSPHAHTPLAAGMVVTVEPGLYLADWGGIRLENMVIVTEEGSELLNQDTTFLDL